MQLGYVGIITNLQMVLNTLKKSLHVDQATQKNTCQIFQPPKKPKSKISNPQNPLITPVT